MAFRWVVLSCAGLVLSISNVVAAQELTTNTVVHGTLTGGEVQTYTFNANVHTSVSLSCVENSSTGSTLVPRITVLDPSLTQIAQASGDERALITLPNIPVFSRFSDGTYTVRIDSPGGGIGDYDLYFVQQPGPSELGALINTGVVHEVIERGDLDTFSFPASNDETVELSVINTPSSPLHPLFQVSNPDGSYLVKVTGNERAIWRFRAGQTGEFGITITDRGGNSGSMPHGTGNYDVHFARIPGANEGGLLAGNPATVHDTIDRGDIDTFTFVANPLETILLRAGKLGGSADFRPWMRVYSPTGAVLQAGTGTVFSLPNTAPAGTHTVVVVHDDQNSVTTGSGPYSLHFARVPGANASGVLAPGQVATGTFEPGDIKAFQFTYPAGESGARVTVSGEPGQVTATRIYGPTGALLGEKTNGVGTYSIVPQILSTRSGVYTIVVSGDAGAYSVSWTQLTAPAPSQVPLPFWAIPSLAVALFAVGYATRRRARLASS